MRNKQISFGDESRSKMLEGIAELGKAVMVTLGPKGRNVVIVNDMGGKPHVTKDGVTVAKSIKFKDQQKNAGAEMIKEVSDLTNTSAGDGTTTSTVLAHAMVTEGSRYVTSGMNPMDLKRGMDLALKTVLAELPKLKMEITPKNLNLITTISANSDAEIGDIVAQALNQAGAKGTITLENAVGFDSWIEERKGYGFDQGWLSQYFTEKHSNEGIKYDKPLIMVSSEAVNDFNLLLPLLESVAKSARPIIIIGEDFSPDFVSAMANNHSRGILKCCLVKGAGFGERRKEALEDIAIYTGALLAGIDNGVSLVGLTMDNLGTCDSIMITRTKTSIIAGAGSSEKIAERMATLEKQSTEIDIHPFTANRLKERVAALAGVAVTIRIGAISEIESKEKRDRFDDALAAGRAALEEGIVPGGGVTLIRLSKALENLTGDNSDQTTGISIVRHAMQVPFRQILLNAGIESARYRVEEFKNLEGVDAVTGEIVDMLERGIIDPAKVTRVALENSVTVSGMILTTESIVYLDASETMSTFEQHMMK